MDMQELGVDEDKLARDRARLAEAGITVPNASSEPYNGDAHIGVAHNPRRKRSDAGTKRTPKPDQPAGKLSREQVDTLEGLIEAREEAARVYLAAQNAYTAFLEQITANTTR
jgi:hypothetical protein